MRRKCPAATRRGAGVILWGRWCWPALLATAKMPRRAFKRLLRRGIFSTRCAVKCGYYYTLPGGFCRQVYPLYILLISDRVLSIRKIQNIRTGQSGPWPALPTPLSRWLLRSRSSLSGIEHSCYRPSFPSTTKRARSRAFVFSFLLCIMYYIILLYYYILY